MGFFMKMQGDSTTGAGHAGLIDALNEVFAPGKEHMKEQQQYDEKVGRKPSKKSGSPLDFNDNAITLVVDPANAESTGSAVADPGGAVSSSETAASNVSTNDVSNKKERPHRAHRKTAS